MKAIGNCHSDGSTIGFICPFFRTGMFHPGYTGKSGPETWNACLLLKKYIREIKSCKIAGDPIKQKDLYIEKEAR